MAKTKNTPSSRNRTPSVPARKSVSVNAARAKKVRQVATKKPALKPPKKPVKQSPKKQIPSAVRQPKSPAKIAAQPQPPAPKKPGLSPGEHLKTVVESPSFGKIFALSSVLVLLLSVVFWTVLSARLHQANADQLVDPYLFETGRTFQGATFPGTHSFFVKWPLFVLMRLYGNSPGVFLTATVIMVAATVAVLVYVLYRIERRPLVFGTLCLALASVLVLVPAVPSPGTLLPVNMAMTTTRNLEYAAYIFVLYQALRLRRIKSVQFFLVAAGLAAIIASDKLFGVLALGSGIVAVTWYLLVFRRRQETGYLLRWLLLAVLGFAGSAALLWVLNWLAITHIGGGKAASPFPLVHSARQAVIGLIYAALAMLTNFGSNPAESVVIVQNLPRAFVDSLRHLSIIAYMVNFLVLIAGIGAAAKLLLRRGSDDGDVWTRLSLLLVGSTVTAGAVFVLTDHYYPVDARYLTIGLFTLFIAAATYLRGQQPRVTHLATAAAVLLVVLPIALNTTWQQYRADQTALAGRNHVTARVSDELSRHKINRLIGDYWDVTPVKAADTRPVTILPVEPCTTPRQVLSSMAWFKTSPKASTAFLAIRDGSAQAGPDAINYKAKSGSPPTYNGCSLAHVVGTYGVPSERISIGKTSGPESVPDVLLLLYPGGIRQQPAAQAASQPDSQTQPNPPKAEPPQPPEVQSLVPFTDKAVCSHGTTLQVVAHEDDDLLFMNPDEQASIKDGRCIRTVYMTAGDAGETTDYWGGRERGTKAAYAQMYGVANNWQEERQMLAGHAVTVDYLSDVPEVALVFMRLPDGNLRGEGFPAHANASLHRLLAGTIPKLPTIDDSATYTRQELADALLEIMVKDLPDQIRTLGSADAYDGDHADHHDVGILTDQAAAVYQEPHSTIHYMGYPDKALGVNLSDDAITLKLATFLTYAKFDGAVCQTAFECQSTYTYGHYLTRQYPVADAAQSP